MHLPGHGYSRLAGFEPPPSTGDCSPARVKAQRLAMGARAAGGRHSGPPFRRQPRQTIPQQEQLRRHLHSPGRLDNKRQNIGPPPAPPLPDSKPTMLPYEARRMRMYQELLRRYNMEGVDPSTPAMFEDHLDFQLEDFVRVAERGEGGQQLHRLLDASESRLIDRLVFFSEELSMSREDLRHVVMKYSRIFSHSLDTAVVPNMEFFEELGIRQDQLKKVLMRCPCLLMSYNVEKTLLPRISYIEGLLAPIEAEQGQRRRSPSEHEEEEDEDTLYTSDWDTDEYSLISPAASSVPRSLAAEVVLRFPSLLTTPEAAMQQRLQYLSNVGLSDTQRATVVRKHPQVLAYTLEKLQGAIAFLSNELGMPKDKLPQMLTAFPQILSLSLKDNLRPTCTFLRVEAGFEIEDLVSQPLCIGLSLNARIRPRVAEMKSIRMHIRPEHLLMSEEKYDKMVERHQNEVAVKQRLLVLAEEREALSDEEVVSADCLEEMLHTVRESHSCTDTDDYLRARLAYLARLLAPITDERRLHAATAADAVEGGGESSWGLAAGAGDDSSDAKGQSLEEKAPVLHVIDGCPRILQLPQAVLADRIAAVKEYGRASDPEIASLLMKLPKVVTFTRERLREAADFLESTGISRSLRFSEAVAQHPFLLSSDTEQRLMPKWKFLTEEVGCSYRTRRLTSTVLQCMKRFSLEGRMRPRLELLRSIGLPFKLSYVRLTDAKFEELIESALGAESPENDFLLQSEQLPGGDQW